MWTLCGQKVLINQHILKLTGIKNIRAIPFGLSEGIAFSIIKNNKE